MNKKKITSTYNYRRRLYPFDVYYKALNQIFMFDAQYDEYYANDSRYFEEYHDRYQRFSNSTDINSFVKDYYFKIRPSHRLVVTSEDYYNKLPLSAKMRVALVQKQ